MIHPIGLIGMAIGLTIAMVGEAVVTCIHGYKKQPEIRVTDEWVLGEGYIFQPLIYKPIEGE